MRLNRDNTVDIKYDDGETELDLEPTSLRRRRRTDQRDGDDKLAHDRHGDRGLDPDLYWGDRRNNDRCDRSRSRPRQEERADLYSEGDRNTDRDRRSWDRYDDRNSARSRSRDGRWNDRGRSRSRSIERGRTRSFSRDRARDRDRHWSRSRSRSGDRRDRGHGEKTNTRYHRGDYVKLRRDASSSRSAEKSVGSVHRDNNDGTLDIKLATGEISYNADEKDLQMIDEEEYQNQIRLISRSRNHMDDERSYNLQSGDKVTVDYRARGKYYPRCDRARARQRHV